jgi:deazaflavin-dependent oxidoreductase (nitroreductase family)
VADPFAEINKQLLEEFRRTDGKLTGQFAGAPIVIVNHTGAKSGKAFSTPLAYTKDGEKYVIIASMGGAPKNPSWYHNLVAHPEVTLELPAEKFKAKAIEVKGAERDRLFAAQAKLIPQFDEYQQKTSRRIPVFTLERVK